MDIPLVHGLAHFAPSVIPEQASETKLTHSQALLSDNVLHCQHPTADQVWGLNSGIENTNFRADLLVDDEKRKVKEL